MDFFKIATRSKKQGVVEVYPKFIINNRSTDLMIRGGDFYAIWDEEKHLWSTDEQDVVIIVDREIKKFIAEYREKTTDSIVPLYMYDSDSGSIDSWHKYCQRQLRDNFHPLDETLIFSNVETTKEDYASKKLNYPLEPTNIDAYEKLISTLYSEGERHKIEWGIGAIITGASKTLQKFMVFYGAAGTGKSTILNIIQMLFEGYYSVFDAKALGSASNSFALEAFKTNPLVAIQHDGDLSKIEDNTRLNSLVSHELMTVNEKFKSTYANKFNAFLLMGTNKPVKITDGKSGLIRRLIDVTPSGNKLGVREYMKAMREIPFELGGIACHCRDVFLEDPGAYDTYVPIAMLGASNDFYNYVIDSYHVFKREDGTSLRSAWERYKTYCEDAKVPFPLSQRNFKEELKNYFWEFDSTFDTEGDGDTKSFGYFKGFRTEIFSSHAKNKKGDDKGNEPEYKHTLQFNSGIESVFDKYGRTFPAQYAGTMGTPRKPWDDVGTTLESIDTSRLHYVKVPANHIVIDFDIKGEDGQKSFEKNLEAASKWPATYAELSKSGAGIHLHYIYTGDPERLSRVFAPDIEIKVFTGNSSLRRKLTKCNDLPIATISSGLPIKEEKVLRTDVIPTEKGLRTTIEKCLRKEIHPGTKPNMDFIKKVLDDAYESGISYDVSDMSNAIVGFAMHSTNHAQYCLGLASNLHYKSENVSESVDNSKGEIIFLDVEVFPNLFLVNWKFPGPENKCIRFINPTPEDIEGLLKYRIIGFNNRKYDNHMLYARLMGYGNMQLYKLSQKIITQHEGFFREAYNLSYTDICDFASAGNKMSLKKWEIKLGIHHMELGLPWDQPVPEEKWQLVAEYCDNDVISTEAVFNNPDIQSDFIAREILADLAGMTLNDTTNTLTTKIIFGNNKTPQNEFNYRDLSKPVMELDPEVESFLRETCPEMMAQRHGEAQSLLPYFPGYKFDKYAKGKAKSIYRGEEVGEGGYAEGLPGMYGNVALLDIASMHPHSTIAECLFGVKYTRAYRDIVEGRVSIKHEAWNEVNNMLNGKLTKHIQRVIDGELTSGALATALKTAINSVYGLTSASFDNPFRDKRNIDNIVAKRGALFMLDLRYEVRKRGFTVAHIKTDSIKIPDATPEIIQFVMDFGKKYGYTFEHEATYDRMCLVNDAVYIAKYKDSEECKALYGYVPDKNAKHGNEWTATGKQFAVPYIFKKCFSHEEVEFNDLCETFSVSKGDLYLDMNEDLPDVSADEKRLDKLETMYKKGKIADTDFEGEAAELNEKIEKGHSLIFVGRVGQFTPIKAGCKGGILYRVSEGKKYAAAGSTGYRWLESEQVRDMHLEDNVDYGFYNKLLNDAVETISKYGDYEWFVSDDPYIPDPSFMRVPEPEVEELPWAI